MKEINPRKRRLDYFKDSNTSEVTEPKPNKRGRKFFLDTEIDKKMQIFVSSFSGGVSIVMAWSTGIMLAEDRPMLYENNGFIQISKS